MSHYNETPRSRKVFAAVALGFLTVAVGLAATKSRNAPVAGGMFTSARHQQMEAVSSASASTTEEVTVMPHVVVVLLDDLGWNDIGYQSTDCFDCTPTLDALAASGITLTNSYAQSVCTPSRAALMTGKYPIATGMQDSQILQAAPWGLPTTENILPQHFSQLGYKTAMVGKWHLGHFTGDHLPTARGFDDFFGFYAAGQEHFEHIADYEICGKNCFFDLHEGQDTVTDKQDVYDSDLFSEQAVAVIEDHAANEQSPLLLYVALSAPHSPLQAPDSVFEDHADILTSDRFPSSDRLTFAAMLLSLDEAVGQVVDSLKANGMWEDTILVVSSDNGGRPFRGGFNEPLRGSKNTLYEGGIKVHAFVTSGDETGNLFPENARGSMYSNLFHISDWLPTLIGGCLGHDEVLSTDLDGVDHWALLTDPIAASTEDGPRDVLLHNLKTQANGEQLGYTEAAIRSGDWKLLLNVKFEGWYTVPSEDVEVDATEGSEISTMLFNIARDPEETKDLSQEYPEVVLELTKLIGTYETNAVSPQYESEDTSAYAVWTDKFDGYLGPWR